MEERVLILAPKGRDTQVMRQLLSELGHETLPCADVAQLTKAMDEGAGTALITEEALQDVSLRDLFDCLRNQPAWSDFPFVLLAARQVSPRTASAQAIVRELGNVVVLERPISAPTLASAVDSALRARRRQYQTRNHLMERERAVTESRQAEAALRASRQALQQLNETLESRINERTQDLARANDRLIKEIAERERAQAALVQAQKMEAVGQLTNGIAHDFNNLLTAIVGNIDMIARRTEDARLKRLAGYAMEAAQRATRLTGQLLAFSRSQRLDLRAVPIDQLIEGMGDLMRRSIGPSIDIKLDLGSATTNAMADANQLELAILNLVINARDAMPDGGVLTITSAVREAEHSELREGSYVVLSITDTGCGIPQHLQQKVFEPFFTTKPTGKGTGLGLSQVYGITQQSGGTVRIMSTPGKGTSVELWLPIATSELEVTTHPAGVTTMPSSTRGEAILVIEDDFDVRRFIVECLINLGYRVLEAENGHSGLDKLQREPPDLLIVDFAMPGINGAEVATIARERLATLPIIFVTGYADMDAVERVIGPKHLLRKPFDVAALSDTVKEALRSAAPVGVASRPVSLAWNPTI